MRKLLTLIAAMALAVIPAAGAAAQSSDGMVTVVHGVPDLSVDVYVNGDITLEGFNFGDVAGPLTLPAADYEIEIYGAGSDPAAGDPALSDTVTLPAGADATIVAHLQEDGSPTLSVFVNDISEIAAGNTRITARHTAEFGAVDILANDGAIFSGVTNGQEGTVDVPADTYNVKITAAGDAATVAFDADLPLAEGTHTIAYAIGSVAGGSFDVAVQTISGLGAPPEGVPTGSGGDAAAVPGWVLAAMALGMIAVAGGGVALARRES